MTQSQQDECAGATWTRWLAFDEVAVPMAVHTNQTLDELSDTLLHMHERRWLRFGRDEAGALYFQTRMDHEARALALLDDYAQLRKN